MTSNETLLKLRHAYQITQDQANHAFENDDIELSKQLDMRAEQLSEQINTLYSDALTDWNAHIEKIDSKLQEAQESANEAIANLEQTVEREKNLVDFIRVIDDIIKLITPITLHRH